MANDMNAMREALTKILNLTNSLDEDCAVDPVEIRDIAHAALAAPARNCDVFKTESERQAAFIAYYNEAYDLEGAGCAIDTSDLKYDVDDILHDYIKWLFDMAESRTKGDGDGR